MGKSKGSDDVELIVLVVLIVIVVVVFFLMTQPPSQASNIYIQGGQNWLDNLLGKNKGHTHPHHTQHGKVNWNIFRKYNQENFSGCGCG